ncbi:MAG TPA: PAS domain-containing protein [Verrucomicrobiae bacterium]
MHTVAVQFLDQGFHRVLFNAMPMPVFVVDHDVSILEYNTAAAGFLGQEKKAVLRKRGGEVLNCLHAQETPHGCGHSSVCSDCVVRKAVGSAFRGRAVTRRVAAMELLTQGKTSKVSLRVTTQPVQYDQQQFVLLILEGLND